MQEEIALKKQEIDKDKLKMQQLKVRFHPDCSGVTLSVPQCSGVTYSTFVPQGEKESVWPQSLFFSHSACPLYIALPHPYTLNGLICMSRKESLQ